MATVTINGAAVDIHDGMTILDAARALGIVIPTMCFREDCEPFTSCMLCVVQDMRTGAMLPSCSARAADGMIIETDNAAVHDARRAALELLLSEHVGDCTAPCIRACPAHLNIPLMLRQLAAGDDADAYCTARDAILFPAVLGRICPAPCQKACRRAPHDGTVQICLLERFAGDGASSLPALRLPACAPAAGTSVAIVGAGPAGLAAAYHLLRAGHACTIFDEHEQLGGALRSAISPERLPPDVLDTELDLIVKLGGAFQPHTQLGRDVSLAQLTNDFNAVVLAMGALTLERAADLGLALTEHGVSVDALTGETSRPGVFACGSMTQPLQMAVRAVAAGVRVAHAVTQFLAGARITGVHRRFDSMIGRLHDDELAEFLQLSDASAGDVSTDERLHGLDAVASRRQAARCLHCDCRKPEACRLRDYAEHYDARQRRFAGEERTSLRVISQHGNVLYEPGKCIKCGLCVQITARAGERLGLTFLGRGFDVRVGVPLDEPLSAALTTTAADCVAACPTGALSHR